MTKSHLIHQATDQIRAMAEVLRTSAQQSDTGCLDSLVLALTSRLIELADAVMCAELGEPIEDLRAAVFGRQTVDAGDEA